MREAAWKVSRLLLNYGAEIERDYQPLHSTPVADQNRAIESDPAMRDQILGVLQHESLDDSLKISLLSLLPVNLDTFSSLIRKIWPYNEFYQDNFEDKRIFAAMHLMEHCGHHPSAPGILHHLCESVTWQCSFHSKLILLWFARVLSMSTWGGMELAKDWYGVIFDTVRRFDRTSVLFEMPRERELNFFCLFPGATPFTELFPKSFVAHPDPPFAQCKMPIYKHHKVQSRLDHCSKALHLWLDILHKCDIDLMEYGRHEKQKLDAQSDGYEFRTFRDVWEEPSNMAWPGNGFFNIRLLAFDYGSEVEDWKLWWSEPTDELVGDFWREMEQEPLRMPGSWNEEW